MPIQVLQKIGKYRISKQLTIVIFLYFFLLTAFLNAILRSGVDSNITVFRLLIPLAVIAIYVTSQEVFKYFLIGSIGFVVLSFLQCMLYNYFNGNFLLLSNNVAYIVHYLSVFLVVCTVYTIYLSDKKHFNKTFFLFLYIFFIATVIFGLMQRILDFSFSTTLRRGDVIVGFYWTENEFSVAIVSFIPLLLYKLTKKIKAFDLLMLTLSFVFIILNDSRIVMASIVLQIAIFCVLLMLSTIKVKVQAFVIVVLTSLTMLFMTLLFYLNVTLGPGQGINVRSDIFDPFLRILSLTPYSTSPGSVYARTNIIIYGIKEFASSGFVGIGAGSSIHMIEKVGIAAGGAALTMHNTLLQCVVEVGPLALLLFVGVTYRLIKKASEFHFKNCMSASIITFLVTLPIFVMSSSSVFAVFVIPCTLSYLLFCSSSSDRGRVL